ncbi:MAG: hypothetical protein AB7O59_22830 [Pirellulales bacterium]
MKTNFEGNLLMSRPGLKVALSAALVICCGRPGAAQPIAAPTAPAAVQSRLLAPPTADGPVMVLASFELLSIIEIQDEGEKLAFSGVLTLEWRDPRQAFDPAIEGVSEKVFSGAFQFDEISPGWYPQVVLVNAAGQYDSRAVVLRVKPDGTSTLSEGIEAVAKVDLNMRRFPFDRQRLELVFRVFGFPASEVALETAPTSESAAEPLAKLPQWTLEGIEESAQNIRPSNAERESVASLVVAVKVRRESLFMLRLVVIPLGLIVMLSWAVFWMDRSSVGDRMAVSFVGILTVVAYQFTMVGIVPNVSYVTVMNGFLNFSFLLMCATVLINLYVGAAGHERGERIDRHCRWIFPLTYIGLNAVALTVALLFF